MVYMIEVYPYISYLAQYGQILNILAVGCIYHGIMTFHPGAFVLMGCYRLLIYVVNNVYIAYFVSLHLCTR